VIFSFLPFALLAKGIEDLGGAVDNETESGMGHPTSILQLGWFVLRYSDIFFVFGAYNG
jgi:hypothetical protein